MHDAKAMLQNNVIHLVQLGIIGEDWKLENPEKIIWKPWREDVNQGSPLRPALWRGGGFPALSHPAKMMETAGKLRDKIRARFSIFSNIGKGKGCATKSDEFSEKSQRGGGSFPIQKFILQTFGTLNRAFWAGNWFIRVISGFKTYKVLKKVWKL